MRLALALSTALFACLIWAASEHAARLAAETATASANADADDLARQLDEADAKAESEKSHHSKFAADVDSKTQKLASAIEKHKAELAELKKQCDDTAAKSHQQTIDLVAANEELAKARAECLKAANKTCPTQAVVDEQNVTIAELRKQLADLQPKKTAAPKTKLEADIATAADSHKLVLAVFSQDKCLLTGRPCFRFNRDVLSRPETISAIDSEYVLSELNIDHDDIGTVKVHYTPAVGIYSPTDKKWLKFFSPNMSPDTFVGQLETEKAELVK